LDRIPSAINDNIIGPLVEQLAQLQQTVNELVNRQSPQPAQVR
jgi:tetrahydromethanopterin S-methyltransferase subunit B